MSDASRYVEGPVRPLSDEEEKLITALLEMAPNGAMLKRQLANARVQEMSDGGMGSMRLVGPEGRRMEREAVAAWAEDADGVPLELSVNVDEQGNLFELDIWRVDYSPLKRLPEPAQIRVT